MELITRIAQVMMFVGDQKRRHQQHAGIAHLPHRGQNLARLLIDMGGEFLEMRFLAIVAGYCISAAVHHDVN